MAQAIKPYLGFHITLLYCVFNVDNGGRAPACSYAYRGENLQCRRKWLTGMQDLVMVLTCSYFHFDVLVMHTSNALECSFVGLDKHGMLWDCGKGKMADNALWVSP